MWKVKNGFVGKITYNKHDANEPYPTGSGRLRRLERYYMVNVNIRGTTGK